MKNLIRKILLEEVQNENYYNLGMKLSLKALKKTFPFIIGWKMDKDETFFSRKYSISINLIIDLNKMLEYYDTELSDSYSNYPDLITTIGLHHAYPFSVTKMNQGLSSDEKYKEFKKILSELNDIYESIPDEFKVMGDYGYKDIDINGFIIDLKNSAVKANPSRFRNYNRGEQTEGEITERCWKGYTQKGMKTMFGKRYPNCIKIKKK